MAVGLTKRNLNSTNLSKRTNQSFKIKIGEELKKFLGRWESLLKLVRLSNVGVITKNFKLSLQRFQIC